MIKDNGTIESNLKTLIAHYHALLTQLTEDKQLFAKNQLSQIDENNERKMLTLQNIQSLSQHLKAQIQIPQENALISGLQAHIKQLANTQQAALLKLISTLETALKQCNEHMIVNRQVINANLSHLRDIFRALTPNPQTDDTVYDKSSVRQTSIENASL